MEYIRPGEYPDSSVRRTNNRFPSKGFFSKKGNSFDVILKKITVLLLEIEKGDCTFGNRRENTKMPRKIN